MLWRGCQMFGSLILGSNLQDKKMSKLKKLQTLQNELSYLWNELAYLWLLQCTISTTMVYILSRTKKNSAWTEVRVARCNQQYIVVCFVLFFLAQKEILISQCYIVQHENLWHNPEVQHVQISGGEGNKQKKTQISLNTPAMTFLS